MADLKIELTDNIIPRVYSFTIWLGKGETRASVVRLAISKVTANIERNFFHPKMVARSSQAWLYIFF
jgi:hypothetical protein